MMFYVFLIFSPLLFDGILSQDFRDDMTFQPVDSDISIPFQNGLSNQKVAFKRSADSDISIPFQNDLSNQRFARHVKAVTESVIEHIFGKFKKRHQRLQKKPSHGRVHKVRKPIKKKIKVVKKKRKLKKKFRKTMPQMKNVDSGISRQN